MAFDHEKLDVYRAAIEFLVWAEAIVDSLEGTKLSAIRHLEDAATSVALNIAEGNGKRSTVDRARFLDIARGSALECAACLDVLVARKRLSDRDAVAGKGILLRIVAMLTKLTGRLLERTSTSTSTSTSTNRPSRG